MLLKSSQNSQENTCARGAWACNFIKNKTLTQVDFPVNFEKFLRTHFLQNTSRRLLLLVLDLYTMLAKWWVVQFVGIDGIIKLSNDWEVSVFNEIFIFFLLMPSVTNSVDMCEVEVFIGGSVLNWLESGRPYESFVKCSDKFLSLSEMLKYIICGFFCHHSKWVKSTRGLLIWN